MRFSGTKRSDRPRFGREARDTAGSDSIWTRGGCHTGRTASWNLQACLAPHGGVRGGTLGRSLPPSLPREAVRIALLLLWAGMYPSGGVHGMRWITCCM